MFPKIVLNPIHKKLAAKASRIISTNVANSGGGDRAQYVEDSKDISREGLGAEIASLLMLEKIYGVTGLIDLWMGSLHVGRNYGRDILKEWVPGMGKDLEIKCSPYEPTDRNGILFMRTPHDSGYTKEDGMNTIPKSKWEEWLPDSYYLLLWMYNDDPYAYKFVGWAPKIRFLDFYYKTNRDLSNRLLKKKLPESKRATIGYPTICLHWQNIFCPNEFMRAAREGGEPVEKLNSTADAGVPTPACP